MYMCSNCQSRSMGGGGMSSYEYALIEVLKSINRNLTVLSQAIENRPVPAVQADVASDGPAG